jgi:CheY-like chemotaxis protein
MDIEDSLSMAVVVGDDGGAVLKTVSATLEKAGFVVVTASSGRAALDRCRAQNRPMDLAVIDTAAAGIKPLEVAMLLHEMSPGVRMLFLSEGNADAIQATESFGHVRRFLRKPFRRAQFLGRVLEMMDQPRILTA